MYKAFVVEVREIRKHSNADRLQIVTVFGNDVIVGLNTKIGDKMIYFPTDGRLGEVFCKRNNLLREDGGSIGENRKVRTVKIRGEKSDGLLIEIESLGYITNPDKLIVGDTIDILEGQIICEKFIVPSQKERVNTSQKGSKIKTKTPIFKEHLSTSQLAYNKKDFKEGDYCTISLKMHGTSSRHSNTIFKETKTIHPLLYPLAKLLKIKPKTITKWKNVIGSRRVVLKRFDDGFYGGNFFRKKYLDMMEGKLHKGETLYAEIVGYVDQGKPIMQRCNNAKTKDKEFIKKYGKETVFSYGCKEGANDIYVYRMTMSNEDGDLVEYTTDQVLVRSEQLGLKTVPILERFLFTTIEDLEEKVAKYEDGPDPIGKTHIREGIVVRIENREKFTAYKQKNFDFKVLEDIIKIDGIEDMEDQS